MATVPQYTRQVSPQITPMPYQDLKVNGDMFGENMHIFSPSDDREQIYNTINDIESTQNFLIRDYFKEDIVLFKNMRQIIHKRRVRFLR